MSFLAVVESSSYTSVEESDSYLRLRVDRETGLQTIPDMDINITKLNDAEGTHFNHFFNNGSGGITFKVKVLIKETDTWNNETVLNTLNNWFIGMVPVYVVTEAVDVPDGEYIITKNNNRQQNYKGSTIWDLEFTSYTPLNVFKFANNNSNVLKAIKSNKKKKKQASKKSKAKKATVNSKLSKCNYKNLVYSKTQKSVKCVKYMQKILYKQKLLTKKQVDGWFGSKTKEAVKKFQKKHKNLKATGKVDKNTFNVLCKT